MKQVTFCFATHNHQPIGNFEYVFEEAFERSYRPFLELASKYSIRFSIHFSGILLEWLRRQKPEYMALLYSLVESGRLEIIGGGYYEPILSVISDRDKQAQIGKLSSFIASTFNATPQGIWLAERVWEQTLVWPLAASGVRYIILDDTHFKAAGLREADLTGYYLTEDQGVSIAAFPISKELRYTIPFQNVDETLRVLRDAASTSDSPVITFADDGEKFGVWPKTFDHVYTDGWLEEFFRKLEENASWIVMKPFSEAIQTHRPKGRIYFPTASYAEMMEWALPSAAAITDYEEFVHELKTAKVGENYLNFVRGGFWRNFFVKYPESNHLHKRVLGLSRQFESIDTTSEAGSRAYSALLAAECNDAYWHGVFGGVYLPNLRHEVYSQLLTAENELDSCTGASGLRLFHEDINADGIQEVLVKTDELILCLDPARGGAISEISARKQQFNITNFINRIPEAYHRKLLRSQSETDNEEAGTKSIHDMVVTKEEGLERYLIYDQYRHGCFLEHFFDDTMTLDLFASQQWDEAITFAKDEPAPMVEQSASHCRITFYREADGITVQKTIAVSTASDTIEVTYLLINRSSEDRRFRFASEWTFGLLAGDAHDRYYRSPDVELDNTERQLRSQGVITDSKELSLVDEWGGVTIDLITEEPCEFWRTPIESVASSEAGFERLYQGSIVLGVWNIDLPAGQSRSLALGVCVNQ